jgi:hypothetical protein
MGKKKMVLGRGKKQCPKCSKILGARSAKCECGHVFIAKTPKPEKSKKGAGLTLDEAIPLVEKLGGISQAKAILARLESLKSL